MQNNTQYKRKQHITTYNNKTYNNKTCNKEYKKNFKNKIKSKYHTINIY